MSTADKALEQFNQKQADGILGYTASSLTALEMLINSFIDEISSVESHERVIDFKDGSLISIKMGCTMYPLYAQIQQSRC